MKQTAFNKETFFLQKIPFKFWGEIDTILQLEYTRSLELCSNSNTSEIRLKMPKMFLKYCAGEG